jgi:hypothetical protein
MKRLIWQVDFYRCPLQDEGGQPLWELSICDRECQFTYEAFCPQSAVNSSWLVAQLQQAADGSFPSVIQVFRPQSLSLIELAGKQLGIKIEPTRRTQALKQWLQAKAQTYSSLGKPYDPLAIDKLPPTPLPENLWGEEWRLAALPASEIALLSDRPIPILEMPEFLLPINLGLSSTTAVPGVIIYGGRRSMPLARWLQDAQPVSLNYIAGAPDGLILEAGLADRWVVATFADKEVAAAAQRYEQRKQASRGLHFLLVQPDDSGMTYSGFWLLQNNDIESA